MPACIPRMESNPNPFRQPAELFEALWLMACIRANSELKLPNPELPRLELPRPELSKPELLESGSALGKSIDYQESKVIVEPLVVPEIRVDPEQDETLGYHRFGVIKPYYLSELPVLRALRPLKQKTRYSEQVSDVLDEEETAYRLAAHKFQKGRSLSLPLVFVPPQARKFDLVIIEDTYSTMQFYASEIEVFLRAVQHGGIFRRIEQYVFDDDSLLMDRVQLKLKAAQAQDKWSISLDELAKQSSRLHPKIFLFLSDLTAPKWQSFASTEDSVLRQSLKALSRHHPVALASIFPTRQWQNSALRYFIKKLETPYPPFYQLGEWVKPKTAWRCAKDLHSQKNTDNPTWLPVFHFSNDGLRSWAKVLNGEAGARIRAIDLSQLAQSTPAPIEPPEPWDKKLQRFLAVASPNAIRMASYLACVTKTDQPIGVILYLGEHMLRDHERPVPMDSADFMDLVCSGLFRVGKDDSLHFSESEAAWELATKLPEYRKYEAAALFSWKFIAKENEGHQEYFWLNLGKSSDEMSFPSDFSIDEKIALQELIKRLYDVTVGRIPIPILTPAIPETSTTKTSIVETNPETEFIPGKEESPPMKVFPVQPTPDYLNIPASRHLDFSFWGYRNYPDRQALLKATVDALQEQGYTPRQVGHVGQEFIPVFQQTPASPQRFDDTVLKITAEAGDSPWLVTYHDFADAEMEALTPALKASYRFSEFVLMVLNYEQMEADIENLTRQIDNLRRWKMTDKNARSVKVWLVLRNTPKSIGSSQADRDSLYNLMKKKWQHDSLGILKSLFENLSFVWGLSKDKDVETILLRAMQIKTSGGK